MFKKFIIAFMFALIAIGYINVKADTDFSTHINNWNIQFKCVNDGTKLFYLADVQDKIITKYTSCLGVVVVADKPNIGSNVSLYTITSSDLVNGNFYVANAKFINSSYLDLMCIHLNSRNGYAFNIEYSQGNYKVTNKSSTQTQILNNNNYVNNNIRYDTFSYNNLSDTYVYIFDSSVNIYYNNVKQNIPTYDIGDTRRDNVITNFEHSLITVTSATENLAYRNHTYFLKIAETYNVGYNQKNDHMFTINYSIPSNTALLGYMNNYFGQFDVITTNILKMGIAQAKNDGVNARYNPNGQKKDSSTYTDITVEIDADYCVDQGFATISVEQNMDDYPRISYVVTDYYFSLDGISDLHYVPQGILGKMIQYYGDIQKALFATAYINVNYVTCYSYDPEHNLVYNPINVYYPDQIYSNGVVAERRNFKTKTDVTQEEIKHNQDIESNQGVVGDEDTPFVNPNENTIQNLYNNSIQDSYNNITNNYYYDNGLTENILDYYRGFSDGATDENIDSALGYVKGTLGSLTHIPLLLSYCFNAFFPVEIIRLFQALLIIFVVFMIIRIIKHLFTH